MVGPEDVAAGVMGRFRNTAARVACPGGLWYGRVDESANAPYARLGVKAGDLERLSDGRYLRKFDVRVEVWGDSGPTIQGQARKALEAIMAGLTVPNAIKVVDVRPAETDLELDEGFRSANDVCLLTLGWQVKIEGR